MGEDSEIPAGDAKSLPHEEASEGGQWPWGPEEKQQEGQMRSLGHRLAFDDDFKPTATLAKAPASDRLPDSDEYLATLQSKLDRLQKRSSLVNSLGERRRDEMRRFMEDKDRLLGGVNGHHDSNEATADDIDEAASLPDRPLMRLLAPERVALTSEELATLVQRDFLAKAAEDGQEHEEEGDAVKEASVQKPKSDDLKENKTHS